MKDYDLHTPKYSLTELLAEAEITPPIMKKYQALLRIGPGEKVGGRTYYTRKQLDTYKRIHQFRLAGVSYEEIKTILNLENKLIKATDKDHSDTEHINDGVYHRPVLLHQGNSDIRVWDEKLQSDPAVKKALQEYKSLLRRVVMKGSKVNEFLHDLVEECR